MILDRLTEDHRNFGRVLRLLQGQVEQLRSKQVPDYDLMSKVLEYFHDYPGRCHHPAEDLLYARYIRRCGDPDGVVQRLLREHTRIENVTTSLRGKVEAIILDGIVDRGKFVKELEEFVRHQQAHLAAEETDIFPRLRETLTESDWAAVESRLSVENDPLFGSRVPKEYEVVYQHISR